ncbi:hypothetical protein [Spiroplasma endosymbiont of Polydrusus formosus]|uniref:hypothetical protein n=1 Tax=Spiroplasma endosymbiont of Polydrusus formosus TaxID=3139326 RepID=UPI0035B52482
MLLGKEAKFTKIPKQESLLSKKLIKKETIIKKKMIGLNPSQLRLLTKWKLSRIEDLFPSRIIRGYQESQEAIEMELQQPRQYFLNNNEAILAILNVKTKVKDEKQTF